MNYPEQIMSSRSLPTESPYESTAQLWFELLRRREQTPRNPLVRWSRWLRYHWKSVALTLGFWAAYAVGYAAWITRYRSSWIEPPEDPSVNGTPPIHLSMGETTSPIFFAAQKLSFIV